MTEYVWELGVDWNAVETMGVSYLREGLTTVGGGPLPGTAPVRSGDKITFRIFDVTSSVQEGQVTKINSLHILTKAAVKDQSIGNGLSDLEPAVTLDDPTPESALFEFPSPFGSWTSLEVTVKPLPETLPWGRFLLTVQVQAVGPGGVRLFSHDPEMVVGPNGSSDSVASLRSGRGGGQPD
jgi:hypothetical protein